MGEQTKDADLIEQSDINELEEIFARKTGLPAPQKTVIPKAKSVSAQQSVQSTQVQVPSPPSTTVFPTSIPSSREQEAVSKVDVAQKPKPSLDGMLNNAITRKKQQIDAEAELRKQKVEDDTWDGLLKIVDAAANGTLFAPQPMAQQQPVQSPLVVPKVETVVVKDNSEAILLLKEAISDPKVKDVKTLYRICLKLEGKPVEDLSCSTVKKRKSRWSLPLVSAVAGLSLVSAFAIFLIVIHFVVK